MVVDLPSLGSGHTPELPSEEDSVIEVLKLLPSRTLCEDEILLDGPIFFLIFFFFDCTSQHVGS